MKTISTAADALSLFAMRTIYETVSWQLHQCVLCNMQNSSHYDNNNKSKQCAPSQNKRSCGICNHWSTQHRSTDHSFATLNHRKHGMHSLPIKLLNNLSNVSTVIRATHTLTHSLDTCNTRNYCSIPNDIFIYLYIWCWWLSLTGSDSQDLLVLDSISFRDENIVRVGLGEIPYTKFSRHRWVFSSSNKTSVQALHILHYLFIALKTLRNDHVG